MWHYIVITGASRGFGKAIALRFAKIVQSPVHFSLSGRSSKDLEETKNAILNIRSDMLTKCDTTSADLADVSTLPAVADRMFANFDTLTSSGDAYSRVIFINNAGSLGPLSYIGIGDCANLALISTAINLNVTAVLFNVRNHEEV